jgi:transcriptional regulator with GAF, ATPase, and Fis domain
MRKGIKNQRRNFGALRQGFGRLFQLRKHLNLLASRRTWLIFAGLIVCTYSVGVLVYVESAPDLGIRSAFSPHLKTSLAPSRFRPLLPGGLVPGHGDKVIQLGDLEIQTWPDLLAAPRKLYDHTQGEDDSLPTWAKRELVDGEPVTFVKGRFLREAGEDPPITIDGWCVIGTLALEDILPTLLWFFLKLALFVVGAWVFWKRPTEATAAQFFLLCIVTLGAYMGGYHWTHIANQPPLVIGFTICGVLLPVVSLHFYLIFPRPKQFLQRHPRWTLAALYGLPVGFLLLILALYLRARLLFRGDAPPVQITDALADLRTVAYVYLGVAASLYLLSIAALIHSFRTVIDLMERNQVKWILIGASLALLPIGYSFYLATWEPDAFGAGAATGPMFAASACLTAAFAVSITRYRLLELDQLVTSGASYFLISFLAAALHYTFALLVTLLFYQQFIHGPSFTETLTVSLTVLVVTVVLDVARGRVRKALDRRFSREKYQLDATLKRMGQAVNQLVDPPTVAQRLLQATTELLGVQRGAVYLREGEPAVFRLAGAVGKPPLLVELAPSEPLLETLAHQGSVALWPSPGIVPTPAQRQLQHLGGELAHALRHEGRLLAVLVLGPKDRMPFQPDDLNLLAAFDQITVLALENALGHQTIDVLNRDLQAKVEKISEQQRRILALQSQLRRRTTVVGSGAWAGNKDKQDGASDNGAASAAASLPTAHCPLPTAPGIVGSSPLLSQVLTLIRKVAANDKTVVLIRGESGTGKELLAQAVHVSSPRAGKAFVKVHCAALSPTLLESELFGHVKGAFTGAHRDKVGRFELANGGTLFLDEIGDIALEVQTKLLRVLQERTFERVGSSEPLTVDVRILAATHQDLEELIRQGRFREDLYYRLNVFPIFVPSLHQRWQDLPELALYFLRQAAERCKKTITHIDDDALAILKAYHWPGNIRQLENVMERAVVIAEGATLTVHELPEDLLRAVDQQSMPLDDDLADDLADEPVLAGNLSRERGERQRRERELLVRALEKAAGNKAEAARALGMARSTLVSKLKKHRIS